jgi:hypothetical protein
MFLGVSYIQPKNNTDLCPFLYSISASRPWLKSRVGRYQTNGGSLRGGTSVKKRASLKSLVVEWPWVMKPKPVAREDTISS